MLAKFHENILNLSENIAKSFRGLLFLTHTVDSLAYISAAEGICRTIISELTVQADF